MVGALVSDIDTLKKEGHFLAENEARPLPQTLNDAISIVCSLGDRYLWIDRLCIVQDHPNKHAIIRRMDSVRLFSQIILGTPKSEKLEESWCRVEGFLPFPSYDDKKVMRSILEKVDEKVRQKRVSFQSTKQLNAPRLVRNNLKQV